jgi:putative peptide maturation dehydrogenase
VLEACDREGGSDFAELSTRFGESQVKSLCDSGLLLGCVSQDRDANEARDDTLREVAWWSVAAIAQAHGTWLDVDIEARNEAGLMLTSGQMVDAFGDSPEPEYLRRKGGATIPMATPIRTKFDELLAKRMTCRNFDGGKSISADDLATVMHRVWGAIGTLELAPGAVAVKKNSPAGGGLHAVEAYLLVQRADGLEPGLYHYLALDHGLELIKPLEPQAAASYAHRFVAGQNWFENVPVMVIMTARFDRLFWKYRRHTKAWRVVHLDVGHLSQTMYLSAADLGLGAFVTAAINDRLIEEVLELTPMREGAIAIVGFGPRAATKTTLELDNLTPTAASLAAAARPNQGD